MITRAYPLRMLVHSDAVGAIIGRSGSTIQTITHQTEARIDVHREDSPDHQEKVITINGTPDACSEACFRIIEIVQNEINAKYEGVIDRNRDLTLKILASSNLIGRLIGRSGSSIKKIMEQTATRVNISTNSITESTGEHTIVIVGKLENLRQAEKLISSKLRLAYDSDMNNSLQTMSHQQPYLFNNVLLPYMPNPYAQNSILASIVNGPQTGHGGGGGGSVAGGGPGGSANTMAMSSGHHQAQIPNSLYTSGAQGGYLPHMYSNTSVPPTAPGLLGYNPVVPGVGGYDQKRETVFVHIPSSMVGAIIGKSGAAIKEMISTSGALIKVATAPVIASEAESNGQQHRADDQKAGVNAEIQNNSNNEVGPSSQSGPVVEGSVATTTSSPRISRYHDSSQQQSCPFRKVTIVGYPASQYSAQYMIFRKISIESKGDISLMVEIYVPSQVVGRIIGKGGVIVKKLQKLTRTTIRLPDDKTISQAQAAANTGETCVQITGDFEGSQAAQRNIRNMVRESMYHLRQNRPQQQQQQQNQQTRNNESNLAKNNAQNNNHQQEGDSGEQKNSGLCNANDKTTTNEKGTDKTVVHGASLSDSCNDDRQRKQLQQQLQQTEEKSQVNSSAEKYDERNGADNNNTIINNLNSSSTKQPVKEQNMKFKEQTGNVVRDKEESLAKTTEWRA